MGIKEKGDRKNENRSVKKKIASVYKSYGNKLPVKSLNGVQKRRKKTGHERADEWSSGKSTPTSLRNQTAA